MSEEIKVGAYLCKGCGLGERLDTGRLATLAEDGGAAVVRQHDYLCSSDGVSTIRADIEKQGVTHVMIGACSRRAKTEAFNFDRAGDGVAVARANLREGVIWTQPDTDEARDATQEMADDYVRMGCVEVKFMRQPGADSERGGNKRILVVGGGVSGLTAALETARAGYQVLLVENTGELGGWVNSLYRRLPSREPYAEPQDNDIAELVGRVRAESAITVFLNATVTRTSGAPGRFSVDITSKHNGTESGAPGHRKHRRDRAGQRVSPLRRQPLAGVRLRQNPGCGRSNRTGGVGGEGGRKQRRGNQAAFRRRGDRKAWCSCSAPASARKRPGICRTVRAIAATSASSRRCISRSATRR